MLEYFVLLTVGFGVLYAFIAAILHKAQAPVPVKPKTLPRVAVLVAMRNEEAHIADCLNALTGQSYPQDHFDIFVLDDRSEDNSAAIANRFANNFSNVHKQSIEENLPGLHGKMNALAQGLRNVSHELVLITDADCVVPESWIEAMVSYFDENTGMVGALTVLYPFSGISISNAPVNLWAKVQALDWIFLQAMAAANSRFGKPITILGNNFGFRLRAYRETGGFESMGFSVTEDFALMEALRKKTNWKIRHTIDVKNTIYSLPVPTIGDFIKQRLRWIKGGRKARPWGIFIMSFSVLAHLFVLLGLIMAFSNPLSWVALIFLILTDALILAPILKILNLRKLWLAFPLFEVFYFSYLLIFSVLYFLPVKVSWKGREF